MANADGSDLPLQKMVEWRKQSACGSLEPGFGAIIRAIGFSHQLFYAAQWCGVSHGRSLPGSSLQEPSGKPATAKLPVWLYPADRAGESMPCQLPVPVP